MKQKTDEKAGAARIFAEGCENVSLSENGGSRSFYRKLLYIAFPVMIQNLISLGLNLIDTLMIGRLGVDELAAVGAANQIYFIFSMTVFGVYSGASVYTAQFWGAQDIKSIRKIMGIDYFMGGSLSLLFMSAGLLFGPNILWLFARESQVIELGMEYLRIVCGSYIITAMSFAMSFNSRAIQRLTGPTVINAIALLINTALNYCLIYGNFGFPVLGVRGAALATFTARVFELAAMAIYVYHDRSHPLAATFSELRSFSREMYLRVMKTAFPVVVSEGSWSVATSAYFVAYGILGAPALAVAQVASVVNEFSQSVYFGLGNASAVIIGEKLGQGRIDEVEKDSSRILRIVMGINVIVTLGLLIARNGIAEFYAFDAETTQLLKDTLLVWALFVTPKMLAYILICGILRAGGDTRFCMFADLAGDWLCGLPLAFLSVTLFSMTLPWAVALVSATSFLKDALCWRRYKQRGWARVLVEVPKAAGQEISAEAPETAE